MSNSSDLLVFWQAGSVPRPGTVDCYAAAADALCALSHIDGRLRLAGDVGGARATEPASAAQPLSTVPSLVTLPLAKDQQIT